MQEKKFKKGDRVRILSLSEIVDLDIILKQDSGHHIVNRGRRHKGGIAVEMLEFLGHSFIINGTRYSNEGIYTLRLENNSRHNRGEITSWSWYAEILEHNPITKNYNDNDIRKIFEVTNNIDDLKSMDEI